MSDAPEKYQGLNLPQLMELMHDPVMATPVSLFPATKGWIVLLAWVLVVTVLLGLAVLSRWRRNRYRREALAALSDIESHPDWNAQEKALALGRLVRRTALAVWDREQIASMTGEKWVGFLSDSCNDGDTIREDMARLARVIYQGGEADGAMFTAARRWIGRHRA